MTPSEVSFLMSTLETQNNHYRYFKDKYAFDLLATDVKNEMSIHELKKSRFGYLTQKTVIKDLIAKLGHNKVSNTDFTCSEEKSIDFNYSLSKWGKYDQGDKDDWYQTSRNGINLVLQLNFDQDHNEAYSSFVKFKQGNHPFIIDSHPVLKTNKKGFTMGWIRLDIDLNYGEVLVEEIQNDWLREANKAANWAYRRINFKKAKEKHKHNVFRKADLKEFLTYYEKYLKKYNEIWDEALLNLAIQFSIKELGCSQIYYHTFEGGNHLKGLPNYYTQPPRSLYTKLPKKFGFKTTNQPPSMLLDDKSLRKNLKKEGLSWYLLTL